MSTSSSNILYISCIIHNLIMNSSSLSLALSVFFHSSRDNCVPVWYQNPLSVSCVLLLLCNQCITMSELVSNMSFFTSGELGLRAYSCRISQMDFQVFIHLVLFRRSLALSFIHSVSCMFCLIILYFNYYFT